jgi:Holliday junction resolvasome RuvABC endonuclease subunit
MKILGLDVSSHSTGWGIIDSDKINTKLIGYGLIRNDNSMGQTQRLYFQGNELKKIIEKFCPDHIGIEETILVRGPKIMRTLARFSGVALFQSYSYQKKEIFCFEPSAWKKTLGVGGNATKAEVQTEICSRFNLLTPKQIDDYKKIFSTIEQAVSTMRLLCKGQKLKRKDVNKKIKEIEKQYETVSTNIYSDCGINSDIADSIAVALAVLNEIR